MKVKQSFDSLNLIAKNEASAWDEAYPLGNGTLGAMVFGGVKHETFSLNHDTLWSGYPRSSEFRANNEGYIKGRQLMREGKYAEAQDILKNEFTSYGSDSYMPLGDLTLDISYPNEKVKAYKRRLDLSKALNTVDFKVGEAKIHRESIVSYPDNAFVTRMTADGASFSFTASMRSPLYSACYAEIELGILALSGECSLNSEQNLYRTDRHDIYSDSHRGIRFYSAVKVVTDGKLSLGINTLTVKDATRADIFFCAESSFEGYNVDPMNSQKDFRAICLDRLFAAAGSGYDIIKARHTKDYKKYFDRQKVDFGSVGLSNVSTKERMIRLGKGEADPALPALLFNFGRYLTIAGSREGSQPMNLQGIWNPHFVAPWHSNYTVNINTEMNYFPTMAANLAEMHLPLCKMVEELSDTGKTTARTLYNSPGWVCHHNSDLWRHTQPVAGEPVYSFWCGGSGWLCRSLYEHYEYTLDKKFLKKIYPVLEGAAEFYLAQLEILPDGSRGVFPSTSPENFYKINGAKVAVSETTEMTMAIVRELFGNVINSADILGIENEVTKKIKKELPLLRKPQIGSDGRLLEWYKEFEENEVHHRHVSHLYGLHPGNEITPQKTPELADACRKTLEVRGDDGTGWSLAWKSNFHARLLDGDHAYSLIIRQLRLYWAYGKGIVMGGGGSYPNLFCAHPPFQIDGNFGALSGMLEMLVQSSADEVHICPAVPSVWKDISVKGIRAKGGRTVDFALKDGKLAELNIRGPKAKMVTFKGKEI